MGGAVRFKTIPFRFTFLSYFVQRFNSTVICVQLHVLLLYEEDAGGGGGNSRYEMGGDAHRLA